MPITNLRVLVVEDDAFTRSTVCDALRFHGVTIVGDAGTASDAMAVAAAEPLDVALLDLDLGGGPNGIDLARALRREHPHLGIVILTTYEDPRLVRKSFNTLPDDVIYLVKRELGDSEALPEALLAAGERVGTILPGTAQRSGAVGSAAGLTEVQIEVMRLVAEGYSNVAIARERVVTEGAIEKLVHRTARQLGIASTTDQNLRVQITRAYLNLTGAPVRSEV